MQVLRTLPSTHTLVSFHNPNIQQKRIKEIVEIQEAEDKANQRINTIIRVDRERILSRFSDLLDLVRRAGNIRGSN